MSLEQIRKENLKKNAELFASFSFDKVKENEDFLIQCVCKYLRQWKFPLTPEGKPENARGINLNTSLFKRNEENDQQYYQLKSTMTPKRRVSASGFVKKKKTPEKQGSTRRSSRIANVPPLIPDSEQESEPTVRKTIEPIAVAESLEEAGETQSVDYLRKSVFGDLSASSTWKTHENKEDLKKFVAKLKTELSMSETSVRRVTPKRISCLAFHPSADRALVMAGSFGGVIAFWDVTQPENPSVMMKHHENLVSMLGVHPLEPNRVITVSYDGLLCVADLIQDKVWEAYASEDHSLFDMDFVSDNVILKGSASGHASVTDLRRPKGEDGPSTKCFSTRRVAIRSISVHPIKKETLFATGTNGGYALLWDMRNPSKFLQRLPQVGVTDWCEFSPDTGSRLLTSSSGDQICIFDTESMVQNPVATRIIGHNNINRFNLCPPCRPTWLPNREDCFVVGSMSNPSQAEIFDALNGEKMTSLVDPKLQSINPSWVYHPNLNILAGGNSFGWIHYFS